MPWASLGWSWSARGWAHPTDGKFTCRKVHRKKHLMHALSRTIPYFYNIKYIKVRFSSTHQRTCKVFSSQDSKVSCGYRLELAQNQLKKSWLPIQNHWSRFFCRPFWTNRSSPVRCGEVHRNCGSFSHGFPHGFPTHDSGSGRRRRSGSRYRRWSPPSEHLRGRRGRSPKWLLFRVDSKNIIREREICM